MYLLGLLGRLCGWVVVATGLLIATAWMAVLLYFDGPFSSFNVLLAAAPAVLVLGFAIFIRPVALMLSLVLALCFGVGAWWFTIPPSHGCYWETWCAQLPWAESEGDTITLHNVRLAEWRSREEGAAAWETRTVALGEITGVELFLCSSRCPLLGQPIISFQFARGNPLCFSFEPRCEAGERFSWLEGFLRRYEAMCVFGEEQDLVKRSAGFGSEEPVCLYRLNTTPERARALFVDCLQLANRVNRDPEWYHTLGASIASSLQLNRLALSMEHRFDWRLLFTGKLAERAYGLGQLAAPLPIEDLQRLSRINGHVRVLPADAEFSTRLREALPGFNGAPASE